MVTISYKLSRDQRRDKPPTNINGLDEARLRYYLLPGDVFFRADGKDFSAQWGWVPIIDFAASLRHIDDKLRTHHKAFETFEFTESDATLSFARDGDFVVIAASYSPDVARVPKNELTAAVRDLCLALVDDLKVHFPDLYQNKHVRQILRIPR